LGVSYSKEVGELDYHEFLIAKRERPERTALLTALWALDRGDYYKSVWSSERQCSICVPGENKSLDKLYNLLGFLGYSMSQEEVAMRSGTHQLFDTPDEQ
jgi:hypothetical protein